MQASSPSSRGSTSAAGSWAARAAANPSVVSSSGALVAQQRGDPVPVRGGQHEHPQPGVAHDVAERRVGEHPVERHADRAGLPRTEQPDQVLGAVRQEEPDPLPRLDPGVPQVRGEAGAAFGVPGVVDLVVVQPERDVRRVVGRTAAQERGDVHRRVLLGHDRAPRTHAVVR